MSIKITFFGHSTTIDNEKHIATGWLPGELSPKGIEQAKELGNTVKDKYFDVIFCSDLKRAVDSAELGFGNKYKIIKDARLRECNYGDNNGKPTLFKDGRMAEFIDTAFPNGESYKDVEKRISDFLKTLNQDYRDKTIAVISHQGPQLALDVLLKGETWEEAIKEDWRNLKAWKPGWEYELNA